MFNLLKLNWPKTLYFNFKYLPLKDAIKIPIFIYKQTYFYKLKGTINIDAESLCHGMIQIGPHCLGSTDTHNNRTILEISGNITFKGKCNIGRGSKICVGGDLVCGNNFVMTGNSTIISYKKIFIGNDCLCSWGCLIMDTDFHKIYNEERKITNENRDIFIGNKVWIGCQNTLLKGSIIPSNTVIAANSTISKKFNEENTIIGGDNRILKRKISWEV